MARRIWICRLLIGLLAASAFGPALAGDTCPYKENPPQHWPGMKLGSGFRAVASKIPKSSGCATFDADDGCSFVDGFGITNFLSKSYGERNERWDRIVFTRRQVRGRGGWLPYGLRWTDDYRTAMTKLKPHGARGLDSLIMLGGCGSPEDNGNWVEFVFDFKGRLVRVEQAFQLD